MRMNNPTFQRYQQLVEPYLILQSIPKKRKGYIKTEVSQCPCSIAWEDTIMQEKR